MNIFSIMNAATMGDIKRLRPMIIWTIVEYAFRGAPYGILLLAIQKMFEPLMNPGTALDTGALYMLTGGLFVSLILLFIISRKTYFETYYESYDICAEGRLAIGDHLKKLSMGFFSGNDPGNIGSYLITDYANVEFLLSHLMPQMFGAAAMPTVLLVCLAFIDWRLAIASALVIPLSIPFVFITKKVITYFGKRHVAVKMQAAARMLEYVQGIRLIKAFRLRSTRFERLEKTFRELKSLSIKLEAGTGPTVLFSSFVLHAGLTVIILLGATLLMAGSLSLPVYIMFLVLGSRVYEPLIQVLMFIAMMNYHELGVKRIEKLRKTPALQGGGATVSPGRYDIEFDDVTFRYHEIDVLKNVSLHIPERSLTAFVGPSGSGKTTMTRLIARFWDVDNGAVRLGGKDIRSFDPDDVLASISMVFQDVYLFNDTIFNNIRVGNRNASYEDVISAAEKARCSEFIDELPERYDTMVGESGSTLSGGEKQRISIARAILKDAPIVLLDEATASLDPENEQYIQKAIGDLIKNKTVVVIAHRLNTVVRADNIVVFDHGSVVEQGSHLSLFSQKQLYRRMWDEQMKTREWKFSSKSSTSVLSGNHQPIQK